MGCYRKVSRRQDTAEQPEQQGMSLGGLEMLPLDGSVLTHTLVRLKPRKTKTNLKTLKLTVYELIAIKLIQEEKTSKTFWINKTTKQKIYQVTPQKTRVLLHDKDHVKGHRAATRGWRASPRPQEAHFMTYREAPGKLRQVGTNAGQAVQGRSRPGTWSGGEHLPCSGQARPSPAAAVPSSHMGRSAEPHSPGRLTYRERHTHTSQVPGDSGLSAHPGNPGF